MSTLYDKSFYEQQANGSLRSARVVVPLLIDLIKPVSVVDIGCGVGSWLRVFFDCGITDCVGVDGDYVDKSMLLIPEKNFCPADMRKPLSLGRRFDLACCLEVAEHIPAAFADSLVKELTDLADVVVFSAAIPGQGGTDHINEQWQSHWAELFAKEGYLAADCIRPKIYGNCEVEWWYQQNILVFCKPGHHIASCASVNQPFWLDRIHPQAFKIAKDGPHSAAEAVATMRRSVRMVGRRLVQKLFRKPSSKADRLLPSTRDQ